MAGLREPSEGVPRLSKLKHFLLDSLGDLVACVGVFGAITVFFIARIWFDNIMWAILGAVATYASCFFTRKWLERFARSVLERDRDGR